MRILFLVLTIILTLILAVTIEYKTSNAIMETYNFEIYIETEATTSVIESNVNISETETPTFQIISEPTPQLFIQPINENFNIISKSNYTKEDLELMLSKGNYQGFLPYVDTFLQAEQDYGVNALYLICVLGLESGWGSHTSGINNIGGWQGDGLNGYKDFNSIEECILYIAENLSTEYVDAVGSIIKDVAWRYCPTEGYLETLLQIMKERYDFVETNR